jgi:hypothetical protein
MKKMKLYKTILYLLFTGVIIIGGWLGWQYFTATPANEDVPVLSLKQPIKAVLRQNQLLSYGPVQLLRVAGNNLIIGEDSLTFRIDTIQSVVFRIPNKASVWRNYWSAALGESINTQESQRWNIAFQKVKNLLPAEWEAYSEAKGWNRLSDEGKLAHTLISVIENNTGHTFLLQDKTLSRVAQIKFIPVPAGYLHISKASSVNTKLHHNKPDLILSGLLCLMGITGLFFTKNIRYKEGGESAAESLPEPEESEKTPLSMPVESPVQSISPSEKEELTRFYLENFYKKYGNFYTTIELFPEFPTDETTKTKVKQQLVEMGLHAHSFARAYLFDYLSRPEKEPNVILIQEQKKVQDLAPDLYKVLTLDGQKTSKRYRFLAKIITEIGIDSLDEVLLNDTYLTKEILNTPK